MWQGIIQNGADVHLGYHCESTHKTLSQHQRCHSCEQQLAVDCQIVLSGSALEWHHQILKAALDGQKDCLKYPVQWIGVLAVVSPVEWGVVELSLGIQTPLPQIVVKLGRFVNVQCNPSGGHGIPLQL